MKRELNLIYLQACMMLPLSDSEIGLLRTVTHQYAMNTHAQWGSANSHRAQEVADLFVKCQEMIDVPQP